MASLVQRITAYFRSRRWRQAVEKAKSMAREPRNREKVRALADRWRARRAHRTRR